MRDPYAGVTNSTGACACAAVCAFSPCARADSKDPKEGWRESWLSSSRSRFADLSSSFAFAFALSSNSDKYRPVIQLAIFKLTFFEIIYIIIGNRVCESDKG